MIEYFLKINNSLWKIVEVETKDPNLVIEDNMCFGVCDYSTFTIYLDKNLEDENKFNTLLHELTHAYMYSFLLSKKEVYTEEELCQFIAHYGESIVFEAQNYLVVFEDFYSMYEK